MKRYFALSCCLLIFAFTTQAPKSADQRLVTRYGRPGEQGAVWSDSQLGRVAHDIDRILTQRSLRSAHLGFVAAAAGQGQVIYARNAGEQFMPASNLKLLTGSAAFARLGTAFAFATLVLSDGRNLYLRGGGDPLLRARDLQDAARAVAASAVGHVNGVLFTDVSRYDDRPYAPGWSWDDLPYSYAPPVSALNLEENAIHVFVSPGAAAGTPARARIEPAYAADWVDNQVVTGPRLSNDTSDVERFFEDWKTVVLVGSYPLGAKESEDLMPAVADPAHYAGQAFLAALQADGVSVDGGIQAGKAPSDARVLWEHTSEPFPQLLEDFWWPSDNLMGEVLLKELGALHASRGSAAGGIAVENEYLRSIGVDPRSASIADGSGLSSYDRLTPAALVAILQADWKSPYREAVIDALPLAGVRGTLKDSFVGTSAEKNVFAKTGSLSHVRAISGYLRTRRHGTVVFSLMVDDWTGDASALDSIRAALLSRIITD
ncbi:MAG: D-alanyl-D-alanine carboxypeptidase/D-alanyl-D-alanine-endopeptidase [Candidatus Meridianibacter frigidus]|nr:MAG: D-alanyl-D-alanine carboxypeptidase/D-alanyl-D-alanine-endopeptidase [Candidatus Eremiobacteraeota bacterium]